MRTYKMLYIYKTARRNRRASHRTGRRDRIATARRNIRPPTSVLGAPDRIAGPGDPKNAGKELDNRGRPQCGPISEPDRRRKPLRPTAKQTRKVAQSAGLHNARESCCQDAQPDHRRKPRKPCRRRTTQTPTARADPKKKRTPTTPQHKTRPTPAPDDPATQNLPAPRPDVPGARRFSRAPSVANNCNKANKIHPEPIPAAAPSSVSVLVSPSFNFEQVSLNLKQINRTEQVSLNLKQINRTN